MGSPTLRLEEGIGSRSGWYHAVTEWLDHAQSGESVNYDAARLPGSSFPAIMASDAARSRELAVARR
jgi:hypothetical protein